MIDNEENVEPFQEFKNKLIKIIKQQKHPEGLDLVMKKWSCYNWHNYIRKKS